MKQSIFLFLLQTISLVATSQKVGIGTTTPAATLEIRGIYQDPIIPGVTSRGMIRFSAEPGDGIDIGKMADVPYAGWIQAGFNGSPDPLTIQPLGGNVGIGTSNPTTSAVLDVSSTTQGFLPPRMSFADRNNIAAPVAGLVVWCTNCGEVGQLQVYNGIKWTNLLGGHAEFLRIGESYLGGYLFYLLQPGQMYYDPNEDHGFVVAPVDQSAGAEWGCMGTDIEVAEATGIGAGSVNCIYIDLFCPSTSNAAGICWHLTLNGYNNWYLPSLNELEECLVHADLFDMTGEYWSSSQDSSERGKTNYDNQFKNELHKVRAIRKF